LVVEVVGCFLGLVWLVGLLVGMLVFRSYGRTCDLGLFWLRILYRRALVSVKVPVSEIYRVWVRRIV